MTSFVNLALSTVLGITVFIASVGTAEAKRMGMGKSFGSKPSYSQPFQRKAAPTPAAQPASAAGAPARSGMTGMLAGLAMGGLLGALFFGGAFENINFFDILIFAVLGFILYKLFTSSRRRAEPQAATNAGPMEFEQQPAQQAGYQRQSEKRAFDTDLLFNKDKSRGAPETEIEQPVAEKIDIDSIPTATQLPKGFDMAGFIAGAESAFARLQKSWDEGDLADIRQFTTDQVFAEIQDQFRARQGDNQTEILALQGRLIDIQDSGVETAAAVLFKGQLREADSENPLGLEHEVAEIWHFVRPNNSIQPTWYLDGIQQID